MADIKVTGINRSNSHENAISHAGSLIVNARRKGDIWEFVGDKELYYGEIYGYYTHLYWHTKLSDNEIIAFNPTLTSVSSYGRRIDIITIKRPAQSPSFTKPILDSNGLAFIVPEDETMLSIHSLNEILVVDTDKNKYFFYWDETAENFLRLEDLPELDVETSKTDVGFSFGSWLVGNPILKIGGTLNAITDHNIEQSNKLKQKIENGLYANITEQDAPFWYSASSTGTQITGSDQKLNDATLKTTTIIKTFINKLHTELINRDYVFPAFRYLIAYELVDGTIIKMSPIFNFIKPFPYTNSNKPYMYTFKCLFPITSDDADRNYYVVMGDGSTMQMYGYIKDTVDVTTTSKIYKDFKFWLPSEVTSQMDIINKWVELDILKSISVYITDPDSYLNTQDSVVPLSSYYGAANEIIYPCKWKNFKYQHTLYDDDDRCFNVAPAQNVFFKFDEEKLFDSNKIFYKVGEFDLKNKEIFFELKGEHLKDVVTNEHLSIKMDLSKKVVSPFNNLYNQMIHKCNVTDITYIKDVCLDHTTGYNPYTTTTETSDLLNKISLDLKIKNKWWRWNGLKDAWGTQKTTYPVGFPMLFITIGIQSTTFYTQDIEQINVVTEIGVGTNDFVILKEDVEFIKIDSTNAILVPSIIGDFKDEVLTPSTVYGVTLNLYSLSQNRYYHPDWKLLEYTLAEVTALKRVDYDVWAYQYITEANTNRMQLSATDNPLVYPAARSYRFSTENNIVIGCETTSVELSAYKYGVLPMYVFTEHGVWLMETAQGDIAYIAQHLLENVKCYNNTNLIKRVHGGVIFFTNRGMNVIAGNTIKYIPCLLEGEVTMPCQSDIETVTGLSFSEINEQINNITDDFITINSFFVYDKFYNELLLIDPSKHYAICIQLDGLIFSIRKDFQKVLGSANYFNGFTSYVNINNNDVLIAETDNNRLWFYNQKETDTPKTIAYKYFNNNFVLLSTTTIFNPTYIKIEHAIARFVQTLNTGAASSIYLFILGSRDGIEWKIISSGILTATTTTRGTEIRRGFISCRYFQLVFVRKDTTQLVSDSRFNNQFTGFSIESKLKDNKNKLR
ncbi:MAG: hypothetical protein BWY27_00749 [Bacteroidetes bacterium ADurb.Bin234]|nr:MAG: hypothetical protein BWY27_00749 [Bacteroidetes bacterium ADurb.Bin234]